MAPLMLPLESSRLMRFTTGPRGAIWFTANSTSANDA
jgi:hypothetical protein